MIEQSLDLDFDLVVSDLAPVDSLLQRAGRLWRHGHRARPIPGPEFLLVSPDPAGPVGADWVRAVFPRAAAVYADHGILWRTAREFAARPRFAVPEDVRPAIEAVYAADDSDIPGTLLPFRYKAQGEQGAEREVARQYLLVFADGYASAGHAWLNEQAVPTRLGEAVSALRLARLEADRLVPLNPAAEPDLAWALSQLSVAERRFRRRHHPEPRWAALATAARADWGEFDAGILLLPLEPAEGGDWHGVLVSPEGERLELLYSKDVGLVL